MARTPQKNAKIEHDDDLTQVAPTGPIDLRAKVRILPVGSTSPVEKAERLMIQLESGYQLWMSDGVNEIRALWENGLADDQDFALLSEMTYDLAGRAKALNYPLLGKIALNLSTLSSLGFAQRESLFKLLETHIACCEILIAQDVKNVDDVSDPQMRQTLKSLTDLTKAEILKRGVEALD